MSGIVKSGATCGSVKPEDPDGDGTTNAITIVQ
jgi:hypothetical protein